MFSSIQSLSHVRLFATPWTAARQASLSITNSWSLPKLMSIELVMPSNHLILSSPSTPTLSLCQHQGLFKWVSPSHQGCKVLEFQVQHQSFFFNFYFYFILLYNTVLVLPYIDMSQPRVYMSSQSWTPLLPPTPGHLSGSSPCTRHTT